MSAKKIRSCLRDEISTNDVAAMLHMDARSVQRAVKAGTIQQSRRGCFILGKIIPAYVDHLRDVIANNPDETALRAAKLRKALADAERTELELNFLRTSSTQATPCCSCGPPGSEPVGNAYWLCLHAWRRIWLERPIKSEFTMLFTMKSRRPWKMSPA